MGSVKCVLFESDFGTFCVSSVLSNVLGSLTVQV